MTNRLPQIVAILSLAAGPAVGSDVDVRARVKGDCQIESVQPVDFGEMSRGSTAADQTAPGAVRYWCTKGLAYTITLGPGGNASGDTRRMKGVDTHNATQLLAYELVPPSPVVGTGRGPKEPEALVLQGTVRGTDANVVPVGAFGDTFVVTITAPACCATFSKVRVLAVK